MRYDSGDPPGYRAGEVDAGEALGASALAVRVYELPAGQRLCPYQYVTAHSIGGHKRWQCQAALSCSAMDKPFVMNVGDAPASSHPRRALLIDFEPEGSPWQDTGVNIQVMQPGQPNCRYHSEPIQEDFLVLYGECIAILEGEERPLHQWDFLHCPAGVEHVFVGAGEGPCAVLMIGSRRLDEPHYPVNAVAAKYDASVSSDTDDPDQAYADWRQEPWQPAQNPWPLGG